MPWRYAIKAEGPPRGNAGPPNVENTVDGLCIWQRFFHKKFHEYFDSQLSPLTDSIMITHALRSFGIQGCEPGNPHRWPGPRAGRSSDRPVRRNGKAQGFAVSEIDGFRIGGFESPRRLRALRLGKASGLRSPERSAKGPASAHLTPSTDSGQHERCGCNGVAAARSGARCVRPSGSCALVRKKGDDPARNRRLSRRNAAGPCRQGCNIGPRPCT